MFYDFPLLTDLLSWSTNHWPSTHSVSAALCPGWATVSPFWAYWMSYFMGVFVQKSWYRAVPLTRGGMGEIFPGFKQWPERFGGIWQNHQWCSDSESYGIPNSIEPGIGTNITAAPPSKTKLTEEFCHFPLLIWVLIWTCNLSCSIFQGRLPCTIETE